MRRKYVSAYQHKGEFDQALADYDKCIALLDYVIDPHKNKALLLIQLGRNNEALEAYWRLLFAARLAQYHDDPNIKEAIKYIASH